MKNFKSKNPRSKVKFKSQKTKDKDMAKGYSSISEAEHHRRKDEITIYDPFTRKWYNIKSRLRFRWQKGPLFI